MRNKEDKKGNKIRMKKATCRGKEKKKKREEERKRRKEERKKRKRRRRKKRKREREVVFWKARIKHVQLGMAGESCEWLCFFFIFILSIFLISSLKKMLDF